MDMHIPPLPTTNHVYNNLDKLVINDEDNNDDIDQDTPKSTDTIDTVARKKRPASILGLKRIPSSIVQTTAALHAGSSTPSRSRNVSPCPAAAEADSELLASPIPRANTPKPRLVKQHSTSTKVIEDLQYDVLNGRNQLDRVRNDLRLSQRVVGQLTRQNEDLRETKERLRGEIEGLNKQMDRKQKLLTEVLDRARTAESSLTTHMKEKKVLESNTAKSLAEMTAKLQESQAVSTKSERESIALREGLQSLKEMQRREIAELKSEMKRLADSIRDESGSANEKRALLNGQLEENTASLQTISALKQESDNLHTQMQEQLLTDIRSLRSEIAADPSTRALKIAETLADEFDRMKRLIRANSTDESEGKTPLHLTTS